MKKINLTKTIICLLAIGSMSCVTIRQGDVGVKRTVGKINEDIIEPGARFYNFFATHIITVPIRTENIEYEASNEILTGIYFLSTTYPINAFPG